MYLLAERYILSKDKTICSYIDTLTENLRFGMKSVAIVYEIVHIRNEDSVHSWLSNHIKSFNFSGEKYRLEYEDIEKLFNLTNRIYLEYFINKNKEDADTFAQKYFPKTKNIFEETDYDEYFYINIKKIYESLKPLVETFAKNNEQHYFNFYYQVL